MPTPKTTAAQTIKLPPAPQPGVPVYVKIDQAPAYQRLHRLVVVRVIGDTWPPTVVVRKNDD